MLVSHPHYPSKIANTLASLVKGEVLSPEKIRATTGGIVTPPTFPKPHYPTRIPYCNRLYALICFHIGTIPLAFRRGAGLPLPLHQSLLFPLIFAKEHLSLALLAPPVTPSLSIPTTFSKAHQPLRTTSLPPLEKGEVGRL